MMGGTAREHPSTLYSACQEGERQPGRGGELREGAGVGEAGAGELPLAMSTISVKVTVTAGSLLSQGRRLEVTPRAAALESSVLPFSKAVEKGSWSRIEI